LTTRFIWKRFFLGASLLVACAAATPVVTDDTTSI
jgi:hypothetical protein